MFWNWKVLVGIVIVAVVIVYGLPAIRNRPPQQVIRAVPTAVVPQCLNDGPIGVTALLREATSGEEVYNLQFTGTQRGGVYEEWEAEFQSGTSIFVDGSKIPSVVSIVDERRILTDVAGQRSAPATKFVVTVPKRCPPPTRTPLPRVPR